MLGRKQDLIIGYAMSPTIAADATIIQVDPSEAEIGRNRGVAVGIAGDVEATLRQLTAEASKHTWKRTGMGRRTARGRQGVAGTLRDARSAGCADARDVCASRGDAGALA